MPAGRDDQPHRHHGARGTRTLGDYARDFFKNWNEYEAPLPEKLRLALRNRTRAYLPPVKGCCGHPGEPGC
jgi:hypothetical protein